MPAPVFDARPNRAPVIAATDVGDLNASAVPEKRRVMLPTQQQHRVSEPLLPIYAAWCITHDLNISYASNQRIPGNANSRCCSGGCCPECALQAQHCPCLEDEVHNMRSEKIRQGRANT